MTLAAREPAVSAQAPLSDARPVILVAGRDPRDEVGGGHSSYVRAHARAALRAGFEPHLFCAAADTRTATTAIGVVHRAWSPARPFRQLAIAGHAPRIAAAIERFVATRPGPHVIHGFGVWGWAGVLAARRLARRGIDAAPIIASYTTIGAESRSKVAGLSADHGPRDRLRFHAEDLWIRAVVEPYERRAYREARFVTYNYDSVRRLIVDRHGEGIRLRRLPYAAESAFVGDSAGPPPAPLATLRPSAAPLVVSVSRHDPRKGNDVLLRALAALRAKGVAFRACLVGEGPLLGTHRRLAQDLGLDGATTVVGLVPDARPFLAHADVFVLPSRREQSGSLALLEALQSGVAAVVSRCDGIPEDVTDGENALLVEPGDAGALAAALERALVDEPLRRRLAVRGRETFVARFSADAFAEALAALYGELGLRAREG